MTSSDDYVARLRATQARASELLQSLIQDMVTLHNEKSADYGREDDPFANFRECEVLGIDMVTGVLTRASDKWVRICNLHRRELRQGSGPAVKDETKIDTMKDLAAYMLIAVALQEDYNDACEAVAP